ncbi:response regulator [Marinomonas epiphytica]
MSDVATDLSAQLDRIQLFDVTRAKALIVDDMSDIRMLLKNILIEMGFSNIESASSGSSAKQMIKETQFDLILCDFNLGDSINGQHILEFARQVHGEKFHSIFIMITADAAYANVVSLVDYEPDSLFIKPFQTEVFKKRLDKVILQKNIFVDVDQARIDSKYETMESLARDILTEHPQYSTFCLKIIGESLVKRKLFDEALDHYKAITEQHSDYAWANYHLALCYQQLEQYAQAIPYYQQTIELNPHFLSAYDHLATAQVRTQAYQDAINTLVSLVTIADKSIERHTRLAKLSIKLKDWITAESALLKVLRLRKTAKDESLDIYYLYLRTMMILLNKDNKNQELYEKCRRAIMALRAISKKNPTALSNSYRAQVQLLMICERNEDAVKVWHEWDNLIREGDATGLNHLQELNLKKKLGLVIEAI